MGSPIIYNNNYKSCCNWSWEESILPDKYLNRLQKLDFITVVSSYVKNVLINNGLKIPIYVTNNGYNHIQINNKSVNNNIYKINTNKTFKLFMYF